MPHPRDKVILSYVPPIPRIAGEAIEAVAPLSEADFQLSSSLQPTIDQPLIQPSKFPASQPSVDFLTGDRDPLSVNNPALFEVLLDPNTENSKVLQDKIAALESELQYTNGLNLQLRTYLHLNAVQLEDTEAKRVEMQAKVLDAHQQLKTLRADFEQLKPLQVELDNEKIEMRREILSLKAKYDLVRQEAQSSQQQLADQKSVQQPLHQQIYNLKSQLLQQALALAAKEEQRLQEIAELRQNHSKAMDAQQALTEEAKTNNDGLLLKLSQELYELRHERTEAIAPYQQELTTANHNLALAQTKINNLNEGLAQAQQQLTSAHQQQLEEVANNRDEKVLQKLWLYAQGVPLLGGAAIGMAVLGILNVWNPVGWVSLGAAALLGLFSVVQAWRVKPVPVRALEVPVPVSTTAQLVQSGIANEASLQPTVSPVNSCSGSSVVSQASAAPASLRSSGLRSEDDESPRNSNRS